MKGAILLRVGLLGLGRVGKLHFLDALHMKDLKVVAIADRSRMNKKVEEKYQLRPIKIVRD